VFDTLKALNAEGLTILLVEQNARQALDATDRAYVIEQGRVVHEGPSESLAEDPAVLAHYLGQEAKSGSTPTIEAEADSESAI
jgi:branched-chain amino acid transport system ATP-binding protein